MSSLFSDWLARQTAAPAENDAEQTTEATPGVDAPAAAGETTAAARAVAGDSGTTASAKESKTGRGRSSTEKVVLDTQLAAAIDIARTAITEVAEATRLVTHYFVCTDPTYRGWRWVAVLARAPRAKKVTVCETALLPGPDALVAPEWVPWEERLEPGDMGPRDTLPKLDQDPNLQPGFQQTEDNSAENVDQIANFEFGVGRERVLSSDGLSAAASRWADSDAGPDGEFASRASANCGSCGYLMPIAGSLRQKFGVCANAWSPFDGRVVGLQSGCGAHSETDVRKPDHEPAEAVVDDYSGELEFQEG